MELYLVRHTSVAVEKAVCYGQWDVALADTFTQEAEALKQHLPSQFDAVYSSPLSRCTLLASTVQSAPILEDPRLMEMHFGDWENKKWDNLTSIELNNWMEDFVNQRTPNGENLLDLVDRVKGFMTELRSSDAKRILIVTHAGVIRCFISLLLSMPYQHLFKLQVGYGQVVVVKLGSTEKEDVLIRF